MSTIDVVFPGIAGSENVESQLMSMISWDVDPTSFTRPKIYGKLTYDYAKSF